MVSTRSISKRFFDAKGKPVVAVSDVTITAEPGKVFGLLGVNGAGKTTLLRLLSTVLKPSSGSATVAGFDTVQQGASVRTHIGFLSTTTALYGRLTAKEVLEYYGQLYGLDSERLRSRYQHVVDRFGIKDFENRLCDKLSTGQKQRVSIARTILHDPPVLFLDEPTAGLDVVTSQTVMEFIEQTRKQGKTIVFSTHIMSEAERLCDDIAVIHEGSILGSGSVDDLKSKANQPTLEKAFLALVNQKQGEA